MRPAEEFRYLVLAIQREGNRMFAGELRRIGLTPSQAEVIRVLGDRAPLTLTGLGELLICESSTNPSRLVDRMVEQDLVRREVDPNDRRYVTLSLTDAGTALLPAVNAAERSLYEVLDRLFEGQPIEAALATLRTVADALPSGRALHLRRETSPTR